MEYDVILIGGFADDSGRPIGPYRLRTALEQSGYSTLVIDSASESMLNGKLGEFKYKGRIAQEAVQQRNTALLEHLKSGS